jgi:hypothetical protein
VPELTWQEVFDADFPTGLVMTWFGDQDSPTYPVDRVEVDSIDNGMPVVHLEVGSGKAFDIRITGYWCIDEEPRRVKVIGMAIPAMLWTARQ